METHEIINSIVEKHGLTGVVILLLFYALYLVFREQRYTNDLHSTERKQWLDAYKENTEVIRFLASKCQKNQ